MTPRACAALFRALLPFIMLCIGAYGSGTVRPPFLEPPSTLENPASAADTSVWHADILEVKPGLVIIAAGSADGLHRGDRLKVVRPGHRIQPRENLILQLPPDDIARLVVLTPFRTPQGLDGTACAILGGDSIALSDHVQREDGL